MTTQTPEQDVLPALPAPCDVALISGFQGSEYRSLSKDYEPYSAMFSPTQMREYGKACRDAALATPPAVPQPVCRMLTDDEIMAIDTRTLGSWHFAREIEIAVRAIAAQEGV